MRFEGIKQELIKIPGFWHMMPCQMVDSYCRLLSPCLNQSSPKKIRCAKKKNGCIT